MNKLISNFELHTGLGPTHAAKLLGLAYVTYSQYRSGSGTTRPLPLYIARAMETIMLLKPDQLDKQVKKHVFTKAADDGL